MISGEWGKRDRMGDQRFTGAKLPTGYPPVCRRQTQCFLGFLRVRSPGVTEFSRQTRGFLPPSQSNEYPSFGLSTASRLPAHCEAVNDKIAHHSAPDGQPK